MSVYVCPGAPGCPVELPTRAAMIAHVHATGHRVGEAAAVTDRRKRARVAGAAAMSRMRGADTVAEVIVVAVDGAVREATTVKVTPEIDAAYGRLMYAALREGKRGDRDVVIASALRAAGFEVEQ